MTRTACLDDRRRYIRIGGHRVRRTRGPALYRSSDGKQPLSDFGSDARRNSDRVGASRHGERHEGLLDKLALDVVSVTDVFAHKVAAAYALWGKGVHPARLNFGDCFAYALARERDCPLLYIGNDFARTDIASALD